MSQCNVHLYPIIAELIDSTSDALSSQRPITEEPVIQVEQGEQPLMYQLGFPVDEALPPIRSAAVVMEEPVSQVEKVDQPMMYQLDHSIPVDIGTSDHPQEAVPTDETTVTMIEEPISQVEQAEQPVMYQFDEFMPSEVREEPVSQVEQAKQPLMYHFEPPVKPISADVSKRVKQKERLKEEESVSVVNKDPGWYKHMFQQFQNTVEECFPGGL